MWTVRGLVTHYVPFVVDHPTRAVEFAGITTNPDSAFMAQVARNLTDGIDGYLLGNRSLIIDRDDELTTQFERMLKDAGVTTVTTSFQAPSMNAIAERFVPTIESECLSKLLLFGIRHLERAVTEFTRHSHDERPHQSLGNELIAGRTDSGTGNGDVRERLGGRLEHYHRAA